MKKTLKLLQTNLYIASFAIFFTACSKENLTPSNVSSKPPASKIAGIAPSPIIKPIINFDHKFNPATFTMQFENLSKSGTQVSIVGQEWNFGDGATSTDKNPTHMYTKRGSYKVSLTLYLAYDNGSEAGTMYMEKRMNIIASPPTIL